MMVGVRRCVLFWLLLLLILLLLLPLLLWERVYPAIFWLLWERVYPAIFWLLREARSLSGRQELAG